MNPWRVWGKKRFNLVDVLGIAVIAELIDRTGEFQWLALLFVVLVISALCERKAEEFR